MARKRVKFTGFLEIPEAQELDIGWTLAFKGKGEITGTGEKLTRKDSGESLITDTLTVTIDADATTLANIQAPQGPLDDAMAGGGE
jgi:hypothetical protein